DTTPNDTLRNLARANLAQTYAMWSRPSLDQKRSLEESGKEESVYNHIWQMYERSLEYCKKVRDELGKLRSLRRRNGMMWKKIAATAENAAGMAHMYLSDYQVPNKQDDKTLLHLALSELNKADELLPNDWANTSDLGSVHLRLGVFRRREDEAPDVEFE